MRLRVAGLTRALAPPEPSGDWVGHGSTPVPGEFWLAVVDGLGHGPEAAHAAQVARDSLEQAFREPGAVPVARLLAQIDAPLRGTRGAAVGLIRVGPWGLEHAGIGNTRALLWRAGTVWRLPSRYGILGEVSQDTGHAPAEQANRMAVMEGDWLLLFTDGLDEQARPGPFASLWGEDPQRLCEQLMASHGTGKDDAAVLAAQIVALGAP